MCQVALFFAATTIKKKESNMIRMRAEELEELIRELDAAGMDPKVCNKPIPYYDATVQAGNPTDPGDVSPSGMVWMPEDLVDSGMLMLKVRGESMRDAGINPGDRIVVDYDTKIEDGDIVVATIYGESTVKTYMSDGRGGKWLVPHNPDFEPIQLTADMGIIRMGKVVQLIKPNPRMGFYLVREIIESSRRKMEEKRTPSREDVRRGIRSVASLINEKRKWYAVYRVLVDRGVLYENAYDTFVQWVVEDVPGHGHLPDASDLPRVAIGSFSKAVEKWEVTNAPVTGKRFRDYCEIARCMEEEL